jgi:uncharacterized protein YyaL (SSP411 family)
LQVTEMPEQKTNRLAESTSPYLQQHARNPVDWWPWCGEALELARTLDRPILLSIGYSACHWCHVMAHESFEDPQTADLMNRLFVNIKVDREERPDLDKIYQTAHQLLARRAGGWPLTVFLTPDDHRPFFAGTYFPREPRHGLPSFTDLLARVERAYREQNGAIRTQNDALMEALTRIDAGTGAGQIPDAAPIAGALDQLAASFDQRHGGFGGAPKFPHPADLELLLRRHGAAAAAGDPDRRALTMAAFTLQRMIRGGVFDQLGGGFYRYSVDAQWMIPHFEKMLYDNGPLLALCCDAWQVTGDPLFREAAEATADWVMREMQSAEGGYFSALDADSEGEEGVFYLWDREQVRGLLTEEEYAVLAPVYGLDRNPNFEGRWHLHGFRTPGEVAEDLGRPVAEVAGILDRGRARLLRERETRVRPGRDEKVLTSWNGLMIKGMARAARVLGRRDCLDSAERALGFLRAALWRDGRLLVTFKDGKARLNAYLDDYANLIDALLELLQTRWRREDLDLAVALAEVLLARFQDIDDGGFFFTSDDHERLIHRPKPMGDESVPSGNGVAARVLQRLGHLLGEARYLEAARGTLAAASEQMRRVPHAHGSLLMALEEHIDPTETLVVRGEDAELTACRGKLQSVYAPHRLVLAVPSAEKDLPGTLSDMGPGDRLRAYRCSGTRCEPPVEGRAGVERLLGDSRRQASG